MSRDERSSPPVNLEIPPNQIVGGRDIARSEEQFGGGRDFGVAEIS